MTATLDVSSTPPPLPSSFHSLVGVLEILISKIPMSCNFNAPKFCYSMTCGSNWWMVIARIAQRGIITAWRNNSYNLASTCHSSKLCKRKPIVLSLLTWVGWNDGIETNFNCWFPLVVEKDLMLLLNSPSKIRLHSCYYMHLMSSLEIIPL